MSLVLFITVQVKLNESTAEEGSILPELQALKDQLEMSEKQRKVLETQLSEANVTVTQLQVEGSWLWESNFKQTHAMVSEAIVIKWMNAEVVNCSAAF